MSFEENYPLPIEELFVEARKRVGKVDKTHTTTGPGPQFAFLGVKDAVDACRPVFDDLGIIPTLRLVTGTYRISQIGAGQWQLFQAVAEFDVVFRGPNGDKLLFRVAAAAVDETDKFSAKLNSVAMREGIKAALLMYDGEANIEDNTAPIAATEPARQTRRQPGRSGTGLASSRPAGVTKPMALKSERRRLAAALDRLSEEPDAAKQTEIANKLEPFNIFEPDGGGLKKFVEQNSWSKAMDVLREAGYLNPDPAMATEKTRDFLANMVKHAKSQDKKAYDDAVKPALAELDVFTGNGQLKKKLSEDQFQAAMRALAVNGFDEPFDISNDEGSEGDKAEAIGKIEAMKEDLDTKPDLPQIDDNFVDENGTELTRDEAEKAIEDPDAKPSAALDQALANLNMTKGPAGLTKGANK